MEFNSKYTVDDYEIIKADSGEIIGLKRSDGAHIPATEQNRDFREFLNLKDNS